jgi:hypothetical protein
MTSSLPATVTPTYPVALTPTPSPTMNIALPLFTPTSHAAVPTSTCDNSAYVSDVTIPDGTVIAAGESFTKTWSMLNTGTCTWITAYTLVLYSGDDLDGSAAAITASVAPNETIYISVDMVAPAAMGSYVGYWRLSNASSTGFGTTVYVMITVTNTYTATPTITPTTELDATSTPTANPIPTETELPTLTLVATVDSATAAP